MARRKSVSVEGARESYREGLLEVIAAYPRYGEEFVDHMVAVDSGEPVECYGWQADLWPPQARFLLQPDGSAVQLVEDVGG